MKSIFTTVLIFLLSFVVNAQQGNYTTTHLNTTVYSMNYNQSLDKVKSFLKKNNIIVESQLENKKELKVEFLVNEKGYQQFDSLCNHLGYTQEKNITTSTNKKCNK